MPDVVLIRPGCTDFDEQHRIQGTLELPLNDRGHEQVAALAGQLPDGLIEVIYTSPGDPARSTADAIGEELGVPVKEIDGLRNLDHGLWQGLQVEDIKRKFPKVIKQWQDAPETIHPPEGETISHTIDRARSALKKPLKKKAPFAIVASEPLATLIRCLLTGCKPEIPELSDFGGDLQDIEVLEDCSAGCLKERDYWDQPAGKAADDGAGSPGNESSATAQQDRSAEPGRNDNENDNGNSEADASFPGEVSK